MSIAMEGQRNIGYSNLVYNMMSLYLSHTHTHMHSIYLRQLKVHLNMASPHYSPMVNLIYIDLLHWADGSLQDEFVR